MPTQRAFEAIPGDLYDAARSCGLSGWRTLWRIELPLAWRGILSGLIMTVAHTLGEFGVVLMVGGSIPGETKTIAISIYDRVQAFDMHAAGSCRPSCSPRRCRRCSRRLADAAPPVVAASA